MIAITIFDAQGKRSGNGQLPKYEYENMPPQDNHRMVPGVFDASFYLNDDNTPTPLPVQPSQNHTFDWLDKQWKDVRTLADVQAQAWERIKARRDEEEHKPFYCDGLLFDGDSVSTQRISASVTLAIMAQGAGMPFSIDWTLANNTAVTLDAAGMVAVGAALGARAAAVFDTARILREQIAALTDKAALDAVHWPEVE